MDLDPTRAAFPFAGSPGSDHSPSAPTRGEGPPGSAEPRSAAGCSVLVLDPEPAMRSFIQRGLERQFALVETAGDRAKAEALLRRCHFDLLIVDLRPEEPDCLDWVEGLRDQATGLDVIFLAADADVEGAIAALRAGALDFIPKPFRMEQLLAAARRGAEGRSVKRENFLLQREVEQHHALEGLVGDCESMREVCGMVKRIAPMPSTVLIQGETGTGKELAARAIHERSARSGGFVAINCGAVSPELLESELFGHVKGAFTGAHRAREGLFGFAHGGTLFLDEIGEMPLPMQAKLLRVLEERCIRPVGGNEEVPVDVRIVAATNRELLDEVSAGRFREDLYYRLNVVALRLPPLRERREDIPPLARHFIDALSRELGVPAPGLGPLGPRRARGIRLAGQRARAAQRDRALPVARPASWTLSGRAPAGPGRACRWRAGPQARGRRARPHPARTGAGGGQQVRRGTPARRLPQDPGAQAQGLGRRGLRCKQGRAPRRAARGTDCRISGETLADPGRRVPVMHRVAGPHPRAQVPGAGRDRAAMAVAAFRCSQALCLADTLRSRARRSSSSPTSRRRLRGS